MEKTQIYKRKGTELERCHNKKENDFIKLYMLCDVELRGEGIEAMKPFIRGTET